MTAHTMYLEQLFTSNEWDVDCSCGWEAAGFEDRDAAIAAHDEHVHSEATP